MASRTSSTTAQPVKALNGILIYGQNGNEIFNPTQPRNDDCNVALDACPIISGGVAVLSPDTGKAYITCGSSVVTFIYDTNTQQLSSGHLVFVD
jgi:hypothetical protein